MNMKIYALIVTTGLVFAPSGAALAKETRATTIAQPSAILLFVSKLLKRPNATPAAPVTAKTTNGGCDMSVPAPLRNCDVPPPPPPPRDPGTEPCVGRECGMVPEGDI
jgi:hypothetical protein